jgi:hypothetical protein
MNYRTYQLYSLLILSLLSKVVEDGTLGQVRIDEEYIQFYTKSMSEMGITYI